MTQATLLPLSAEARRPPTAEVSLDLSRVRSAFSSHTAMLDRLANTPVFISHDEADDSPPIRESVQFVERSKARGVDATLARVHGGPNGIYQNPMAEKRSQLGQQPAAR